MCPPIQITKFIIGILILIVPQSNTKSIIERQSRSSLTIGPCTWVIDRKCPDIDVKFYLFTRHNIPDRQLVHIDETLELSNITSSNFNPIHPTKIIIHGYNADMFLQPLIDMKDEYLQKGHYNLFYVDWSNLSPGPCYFSAVHNARHTGNCIGQLIERILDLGSANIHLIGFSLGAQVTNFVAKSVGSFVIPRITGLDPAMPLFITASNENKLDESDAAFVDIIHTNAFVQGKIERCGHVDFYMNGGIMQPGCMNGNENIFACSHHRAPDYFAESIRSYKGFWGWACSSYISYLLGLCPQTNYLVIAGEDCSPSTKGMFLVTTNDRAPFALGKWPETITKIGLNLIESSPVLASPYRKHNPLLIENVDQWGKLDSTFNNIDIFPTPFPQDPNAANNWPYFGFDGTNEITQNFKKIDSVKVTTTTTSTESPSIDMIKDQRTPPNIKRHRKPIKLPSTSATLNRENFLESYKENLTIGIIDQNIFQLPVIQEH